MKYLALLGRVFFSLIFILAATFHFSQGAIDYAMGQGVPMANILVPISGVLAMMGGLSIAVGFKTKWGAWLIVLFLVPLTLMMHNFWAMSDPMMAQVAQAMFMKNLSMLGGALYLTQVGSGPLSLDAWKKA